MYLNVLDHFVKEDLRARCYLRYVDDFLLFADDKRALWEWRERIRERLARLRLTVHDGACPKPVSEGLPFLGFTLFPTHRRLRRTKGIRYLRRLRGALEAYSNGEIPLEKVTESVAGWVNHVRHGDTWGLRRALFQEFTRYPSAGAKH